MKPNLPQPPAVSVDQTPVTPLRPPAPKGKQLRLVIRYEDREPSVHPLMDQITTIGRRKDNDIVIPFDYISGHHAQFQRLHDGAYQVMDLGSQNGTSINGKKIRKGKVQPGDILVFGILGGILEEVDATAEKPSGTPQGTGSATKAEGEAEVRDEYNRLLEERKRLQEEREELRRSIDRMKREREAAQGQTVPVQNRESSESPPAPPQAAPGTAPVAATEAASPEAQPEEGKKLEELHDEVASIDSRRILIRSNVKRLEDQIDESANDSGNADQPEGEKSASEHKEEIASMKSDLSEKEEELETFLSRLNTARIEPDEYDDTTDEFKEILGDFDQLCSELETKVQRLEGELRTKLETLPGAEAGAGEEELAESGTGV